MISVEVLDAPDKSEIDKKSYRVIRLPNGLKALLISTAEHGDATKLKQSGDQVNDSRNEKHGELAACSLCVDVGSFSDPRDVQGLAHFLEHMILMGSEKYPSENEFEHFMQTSGGFDNATTDFDETTFFFETQIEFLDEALDRFSQFFKAPLMLKEAMTREREAVESEFASKKNGEDIRRGQLLSLIGQQSHPSSVFAWGNLETLKKNIEDDVLYQTVHDFRKRHYSAHRMYVCLQSKLPLDDLQDMVFRHFSNIPSNDLPGDDFSAYTHHNAFQSKFYEKVYFVKPIRNISKIEITWCLEPMLEVVWQKTIETHLQCMLFKQNFKCKPVEYLSHILGYEGEGSLVSYLRKKLWAVDLAAGNDTSGKGSTSLFSMFVIWIHLTEDGFDHLDDVLEATFSYLKLLKSSGPKESIFREIQTTYKNNFKFSQDRDALSNVKDLVISLKQYPSKYILSGDSLFFEYDPGAIQKIIDELNSRKFNIMITSTRRYNEKVMYESTEPWFGTVYTEMDVPLKWISLWENATPFIDFTLPQPNPFIADDFTILYKDGNIVPKYPIKILDNDLCELWFRQDDTFLLPTACYNFHFMTPNAISSIDNTVMMTLLTTSLKYQFVTRLYPATVAGLEYTCYTSFLGLVFNAVGFSQKLHLIYDVFSKCLKSLADDLTEKQFDVFVQQQFKTYENIFLRPKILSKELSFNIIRSHDQPLYEKNKRLRSITFANFQHFCRNFCKQVRIKALVQGNVTEERALNVVHNLLNELDFGRVEDMSSMKLRAAKLPVGVNYLRCKTFDPVDINTFITNFYQIGPISHRTRALIDLLVMVAHEPLFDTLRNKEQLAYDVSFRSRADFGVLGYTIVVNSQEPKFSVDYVDKRIENFRYELTSMIENMSDDDFDAIKSSLAKNKLNEDNKLSDEVNRNWAEMTSDAYEFDRRHREVESLSTITKNQLLEFYLAHYGEKDRQLSVQVIGNANVPDRSNDAGTELEINEDSEIRRMRFDALTYVDFYGESRGGLIKDLMEFKKSLEVYPYQ